MKRNLLFSIVLLFVLGNSIFFGAADVLVNGTNPGAGHPPMMVRPCEMPPTYLFLPALSLIDNHYATNHHNKDLLIVEW